MTHGRLRQANPGEHGLAQAHHPPAAAITPASETSARASDRRCAAEELGLWVPKTMSCALTWPPTAGPGVVSSELRLRR